MYLYGCNQNSVVSCSFCNLVLSFVVVGLFFSSLAWPLAYILFINHQISQPPFSLFSVFPSMRNIHSKTWQAKEPTLQDNPTPLSVACVGIPVSLTSFFNAKSVTSDLSTGIINKTSPFFTLRCFYHRYFVIGLWSPCLSNFGRYCSNIYPKIESCGTCNWCLSQKEEKSPNSSNSSSPYRNNFSTDDEIKNKKIRKGLVRGSSALQLQLQKPIKKQKSPERTSPSASTSPQVLISTRKRIVTNGALEERLRRTKSEDITNRSSGGATKQVFRNKVRRYKLLDEVSS